jgi:hypothetical protein
MRLTSKPRESRENRLQLRCGIRSQSHHPDVQEQSQSDENRAKARGEAAHT